MSIRWPNGRSLWMVQGKSDALGVLNIDALNRDDFQRLPNPRGEPWPVTGMKSNGASDLKLAMDVPRPDCAMCQPASANRLRPVQRSSVVRGSSRAGFVDRSQFGRSPTPLRRLSTPQSGAIHPLSAAIRLPAFISSVIQVYSLVIFRCVALFYSRL